MKKAALLFLICVICLVVALAIGFLVDRMS